MIRAAQIVFIAPLRFIEDADPVPGGRDGRGVELVLEHDVISLDLRYKKNIYIRIKNKLPKLHNKKWGGEGEGKGANEIT